MQDALFLRNGFSGKQVCRNGHKLRQTYFFYRKQVKHSIVNGNIRTNTFHPCNDRTVRHDKEKNVLFIGRTIRQNTHGK
jgi:hypothetical protein